MMNPPKCGFRLARGGSAHYPLGLWLGYDAETGLVEEEPQIGRK